MKKLGLFLFLFTAVAGAQIMGVGHRYVYSSSPPSGPTFVQGNGCEQGNTSPLACAFSSNNTAGNTIIAIGLSVNRGGSNGVTDSQGNTYTQVYSEGNDIWVFVASGINAGANTVTFTSGGGGYVANLVILEYSNLASSSPFDTANATNGAELSGNPLSTGSITTTVAGDLILVVGNALPTVTSTGGRALLATYAGSSSSDNVVWSGIEASTGTYSDGVQSTTNSVITAAILAFKPL